MSAVTPLRKPIPRRTLHAELVERLREMIHAGDLPAGEKIPEKALCEQFEVSRTPLREALKVLAADGLVRLTPNRGASVAALTLKDLEEVFPIIASLEGLSGELACERIDDDGITAIRVLHEEMAVHYQARDLPEYFRLNQAIHRAILRAADNASLEAVHENLAGRISRARYVANMSAERWQRAMAEHDRILEALEQRDSDRLGRLLREHVMTKLIVVRQSLADAEVASS